MHVAAPLANGRSMTRRRISKRRGRPERGSVGVTASTQGRQQRLTAEARPRMGAPDGLPALGRERDLFLGGDEGGAGTRWRMEPGWIQSVG